jgi:hypothetical protein
MKNAKSDYSLDLVDHFFEEENKVYILVMPYCKLGSIEAHMDQ